jgi:hypothetical protein
MTQERTSSCPVSALVRLLARPARLAALHIPTLDATDLVEAHRVQGKEFVLGEVVFETECALIHTACAALESAFGATNVFRKEGEYWTISYRGAVVRLKDGKGLRYLAQLLHHPDREFHALDLMHLDPPAPSPEIDHPRVWDVTGTRAAVTRRRLDPLLDAKAKKAYRHRLGNLRENLREAEHFRDVARAERARAEIDFLLRELSGAVGLGGRDRATATPSERARVAVTLRIREVLSRLRASNPTLGCYLATSIKTGRFCSYTPPPGPPVKWTF